MSRRESITVNRWSDLKFARINIIKIYDPRERDIFYWIPGKRGKALCPCSYCYNPTECNIADTFFFWNSDIAVTASCGSE